MTIYTSSFPIFHYNFAKQGIHTTMIVIFSRSAGDVVQRVGKSQIPLALIELRTH